MRLASFADRTQKLKDARSEAAKEIEELKSKKEEEFQKYKKDVSKVRDGAVCPPGKLLLRFFRKQPMNFGGTLGRQWMT